VAALVTGDSFSQWRVARAHQTLPIPVLRWPNRAGLGSGTGYGTWVIHLGPWRGSARLRDAVVMMVAARHGGARRRARVHAVLGTGKGANGAARVRGAKASQNRAMWWRCSAAESSPQWSSSGGTPVCGVPTAGAGYDLLHPAQKGQERALVLTEGSDWLEKQRRVAGSEVRAVGMGQSEGRSCCRGPPSSWTPRVDSWCSCGGTTGVKRVGEPPAARDRGGGANYRRQSLVQFRPLHGPGSRVKASRSFLAPRRSYCGVSQGWRCSGAVVP
jgi:hypothetical protein